MDFTLLTNFPEHLSASHAHFQFWLGLVLAITSGICFLQSDKKSLYGIILLALGGNSILESMGTGTLHSSDTLLLMSAFIGLQIYYILRNSYKFFCNKNGYNYSKPAWVQWLFPNTFPTCSILISVFSFLMIYTTIIQ